MTDEGRAAVFSVFKIATYMAAWLALLLVLISHSL